MKNIPKTIQAIAHNNNLLIKTFKAKHAASGAILGNGYYLYREDTKHIQLRIEPTGATFSKWFVSGQEDIQGISTRHIKNLKEIQNIKLKQALYTGERISI